MPTAQLCAISAPTPSQIQSSFEKVPQFLKRVPGENPPALKVLVKIPYAGKETPEETKAIKAELATPRKATVLPAAGGSAAALRKAIKGSTAPKVAKKEAAVKTKPQKAAKPAQAQKAVKVATAKTKPASGKTKLEAITALLLRKAGTTNAEILAATQWPSVSVPQQAAAAGLKLRKEKVKGKPTRYYGSK